MTTPLDPRTQWIVDQHGARKKKPKRTRSDWANRAIEKRRTKKAGKR